MKKTDASLSLRVCARLLSYPDQTLREHMDDMRAALQKEQALSPARLAEFDALLSSLARSAALEAEARYVELFDRGRATSLHLFEHVHGDSRERGPAMIDLAQTYEKAGLYVDPNELPDYLPVVLEFASTQPPREARAFLAEMAHILNVIFNALQQRNSPYACVLGGLLDLAGEKASAVSIKPDEALDEAWEEPVVFDGCSVKGQARPGQPQTVHFVKPDAAGPNARGAAVQGAML
jgi:nitrate reductase delta subunit